MPPPRWSSGRAVLLGLAALVTFSVLFLRFGPYARVVALLQGRSPLETTVGYDATDVYRTLDALGAEGRPFYRRFLLIDLAYPLFYGAPLALTIAWSAREAFPRRPALGRAAAVPLAAGVADLVENALLLTVVRAYPALRPSTAALAGVVTTVKLLLVYGSFALTVGGVGAVVVRRLRGRGEPGRP